MGRVTIGYYVLDDGILTMTDGEGAPFRSTGGDRITHRLQSDEDPTVIARRLTMKIYRMVRGGEWLGSIVRSTIIHQALPDTGRPFM